MTTAEWISKARGVVPSSDSANRLLGLLGRPAISNDEIVAVIRCDGVLTAKLLQLCNSPVMGLRQRVASVDQALFLLGHSEVFRIVMAISYSAAMKAPVPGYAVAGKEFFRHSLATAAAAEIVQERGFWNGGETHLAFTAGLLQDLGELVIDRALTPELVARMRERVEKDGLSRVEAEREILQTDHAEIGAGVLRSWNLPDDLVEAVAHHHQPVLDPTPRLSVVSHLADCLAHLAGAAPGWGGYAVRVSEAVIQHFRIDPDRLDAMVIATRGSIERMDKFSSGL
ncbi:MAG: HDOD domain-containing protein [Verrucomicrobiales bacterium]|nr:HDOD domain-containing protein [Verrucomicrobiales bacterium]